MPFRVEDVFDEAQQVFGLCDETKIFGKLTDAVEILANSGEYDPLQGFVDICVTGQCITLPREVDTVEAVNIGGRPAIGRNSMYRFHLNGLGDCRNPCSYSWEDLTRVPVFRDITEPTKLVAFVQNQSDIGKELRVYGYDNSGVPLRTQDPATGAWTDGYLVPTLFGVAVPEQNAPTVARISRVYKAITDGPVKLTTFDYGPTTGSLLGFYEPDETDPEYSRIRIGVSCNWVRVAYRKRIYRIRSRRDWIPLPSHTALTFMCKALKKYDEEELSAGAGFEATARRLLMEASWAHSVPNPPSIQVNDETQVVDKTEFDIS